MSGGHIAREVVLRDGPHHGVAFAMDRLTDTLLISDEPLEPDTPAIDPMDPPFPVAVYELVTEYIESSGVREGVYVYAGHRHPVRHRT